MELELPSPNLSSIFLTITILLASYITIRCMTPPNHSPSKPTQTQPKDRVEWVANSLFLDIQRLATILITLHHGLLVLYFPVSPTHLPSPICPHPTHLSPTLFTWSPTTAACLTLILLFGLLRLHAFSTLGPSFTFRLSTPKKLVTTGIYAWVQHPSYTCQIIVVSANAFLLERRGGVLGCWIGPYWDGVMGWVPWVAMVVVGGAFGGLAVRVRDEEGLLRREFGEEWVRWHAKTARFVPGVF